MKECMIMNIASVVAGSVAIGIACYVTKSAWPLLAFMLIPKWNYNYSDENQEGKKDE